MLIVVLRTIARLARGVARALRRAWNDTRAAQELLVDINTPWRHDGELRWRRGSSGWELHGNRLPEVPS
ncbi:MAG TPA: hypothetical protein VE442_02830 [Jatrophihabitans sp.]|nr:hypothetical protein [Jatrophihabitans sp.]